MTHQSIDAHVAKLLERRDKFIQLIETNSQTAHSCIDFDVNIGNYSSVQSRSIQRLDHIEPVDHRSQSMLNADRCLSGPETSETQQWLGNAGSTQFDSLFWKRDAKPLGAFIHQPPSALDRSMTVCVCLDDSHHASSRTYALPDVVEVCCKVVKIDLGPGRSPAERVFLICK